MPNVFRAGLLLGATLIFAAGAGEVAAQGMGSGPIQTVPWATAKQRTKPAKDDPQKGAEADVQPTTQLRAEPIAGTGPADVVPPKN
jgi:hypothetical protein